MKKNVLLLLVSCCLVIISVGSSIGTMISMDNPLVSSKNIVFDSDDGILLSPRGPGMISLVTFNNNELWGQIGFMDFSWGSFERKTPGEFIIENIETIRLIENAIVSLPIRFDVLNGLGIMDILGSDEFYTFNIIGLPDTTAIMSKFVLNKKPPHLIPIPEPSTSMLFLTGCFALIGKTLKRRK